MSGDQPREGERIGHFRVVRRLGSGAMGVVYEALDENLDRAVALKVIAPELAGDPGFRERFRREAQAQASLFSPHVALVYAHGEDDGRLWIATQLVPGSDLRSHLDTAGALPVPVAVRLMTQVADGLADAHAAGLVHRDIKPANVLLRLDDSGMKAYLADFGIARRFDAEATRTSHSTIGTPSYMAPELHTGGEPGVASDVYSLGCLLWAVLTGRAPYAGTSDFEIVTAHRDQPVPQLPPDAPLAAELNDVLRRCLAKDPADRPPSAAAVRDRLRSLRPAPPPAPSPVAQAPRRRPWPAVLLVVALVVIAAAVLGVGWAVTRDGDEPGRTTLDASADSTPSDAPAGDEETAVASMAAAFATQPGLTPESAECLARSVIDEVGLAHLVEIGMFDEELTFTDIDLADHPDVKAALSTGTLSCVPPASAAARSAACCRTGRGCRRRCRRAARWVRR